ncbi:HGxxPAAW family protein [Kribbia dieselivorans]|uniref:HGxxPAAW family protein n=1 Tax=Kribbia dieselivorans TaxID=331526 RepID=UPI0008385557|nr:HGxxPAAW family protein [Kribbia dieselivorans]
MAGSHEEHEYGQNIASWVAILICFAGFVLGGLGAVGLGSDSLHWPLIWTGIVLIVLSPIVGLALGKSGFGEERARAKRAEKLGLHTR